LIGLDDDDDLDDVRDEINRYRKKRSLQIRRILVSEELKELDQEQQSFLRGLMD
jgi:replication-associated recombination protein RarA